ncbi:uncharacterized protein LOC101448720 isoform X2 [Ceratitis capitata]|uniref:uncharacterized protein LOC101448720 isoform X2 n=1 Tax=Ceratitis capitata TaxID=7213 RepID=UPI0006187FF2|nr:uncharacterized protein LOC101448720 isoform X2 [Ceratitis capitata]
MSKFCGVISKRLNSEQVEPLRFIHLEILTDWLTCETESLESDFLTKSEAVREAQLQVFKNEQQLIAINDIMKGLKLKMSTTEQELEVNEASIKLLESNINALDEHTGQLAATSISCGCPLVCVPHEQQNMLKMLENTDHNMARLNMIMNEVYELQPYVQRTSNPYHTVSSILDCQVTTLKQTEKNLDRLAEKLNGVDGMFRLAMRRASHCCTSKSFTLRAANCLQILW